MPENQKTYTYHLHSTIKGRNWLPPVEEQGQVFRRCGPAKTTELVLDAHDFAANLLEIHLSDPLEASDIDAVLVYLDFEIGSLSYKHDALKTCFIIGFDNNQASIPQILHITNAKTAKPLGITRIIVSYNKNTLKKRRRNVLPEQDTFPGQVALALTDLVRPAKSEFLTTYEDKNLRVVRAIVSEYLDNVLVKQTNIEFCFYFISEYTIISLYDNKNSEAVCRYKVSKGFQISAASSKNALNTVSLITLWLMLISLAKTFRTEGLSKTGVNIFTSTWIRRFLFTFGDCFGNRAYVAIASLPIEVFEDREVVLDVVKYVIVNTSEHFCQINFWIQNQDIDCYVEFRRTGDDMELHIESPINDYFWNYARLTKDQQTSGSISIKTTDYNAQQLWSWSLIRLRQRLAIGRIMQNLEGYVVKVEPLGEEPAGYLHDMSAMLRMWIAELTE